MLNKVDYCDYNTCVALKELGFNDSTSFYYKNEDDVITILAYWRPELVQRFSLYEVQKWLREKKGIHIAPRIYLYHDVNLDEQTSWECTLYIEYAAIYTIGKSLTYEDALLLGIHEAIRILKDRTNEDRKTSV
jgi:hypothetical protein